MFDELITLLNSTEINAQTSLIRLIISFLLGSMIGIERQFRRREAGLRTFTLICLGSTTAMLLSIWMPQTFPDFLNGDPGRIAAQVLTGIGFLGAGAIIHGEGGIHGLTTAACIWVISVIGLAVGAGMFITAIITTICTVGVLIVVEALERRLLLDGVNKILVIVCSTANPDLKKMRTLLEQQKVYIVSNSYEIDYETNKSTLTYRINVKSISSYTNLFNEIKQAGNILQIKVVA